MLGLRVSEACATDITDLRYEAGYELLHVLGKGAKPADIPLPIPVLRAVRDAIDGRSSGPILRTADIGPGIPRTRFRGTVGRTDVPLGDGLALAMNPSGTASYLLARSS